MILHAKYTNQRLRPTARFDGGLVGWDNASVAEVRALMAALQPEAMAFQGPTRTNPVRWIGNENGHAAAPNYIASEDSMADGPGHLNGSASHGRVCHSTMPSTSCH